MFLESYKPRYEKVKTRKIISLLKYAIFLTVLVLILLVYIFSNPKKNKTSFQEEFFIGSYEKSNNIVKIENATFVGKDKKKRPYTLTAELAVKESSQKNFFKLNFLKADITLSKGSWLILKTDKAIFDIKTKILVSEDKVEAFYDNGTVLVSPHMRYDLNSGIISGQEGIVMFGKWGKLKSGNFFYNANEGLLVFSESPVVFFNK